LEVKNFIKDMHSTWKPGLFLERKDNNGPYFPGNCCWVTWVEQCLNKRTNHWVECDGMVMTLSQWEAHLKMPKGKLSRRLYEGWTIREALEKDTRHV
jgi:hypothetical protein